jgi:hypothetical protein
MLGYNSSGICSWGKDGLIAKVKEPRSLECLNMARAEERCEERPE